MKTTVNLPDELFRQAKMTAVERNVTLTELFESAVRHEIFGSSRGSYKMEDRSFKGEAGLLPGVDLSDWTQIRDLVYGTGPS
jgi:hypothetical protein